ncbi:Alpha/Beta hydrolase protein, partial [Hyaloraphidium curvatum]
MASKYAPGSPLRMLTVEPSAPHTATVVFLHGFGDTGMGWEFLADALAPHLPHVKWVLPHAPIRPISAFGGQMSHAWYDFAGPKATEEAKKRAEEGMRSMAGQLTELLKAHAAGTRLVLGGFSQGCAMSTLLALTSPSSVKLSGLMLLSGGILTPSYLPEVATDINRRCPTLICHGTEDDRVSVKDGAERTEKALKGMGWTDLRMKIYGGLGHAASEEEVKDIWEFLREVIP